MFINGEKVTKDNSIKVIFNKIKSKQRKKDIKNAMKQKKELQKITIHVEKSSTKGVNFDENVSSQNILEDDLTIIGIGK